MLPIGLFISGIIFALLTVGPGAPWALQCLGWIVFGCTTAAAGFIGLITSLEGRRR